LAFLYIPQEGTEVVTRKLFSATLIGPTVLALAASSVGAQTPANVLAGKICPGTLTTGPGADEKLGQGAVFIRFVEKDGTIDPDLRVNMGKAAFENPLVEIPPARTQKLKNF
jgi:hypothetical protein